MIVCYDPRTGAGCETQNVDGTPFCLSCGMALAYAVRLHNVGDRVGSYRIIGVLGHGGVGAVYEAEALPGMGLPSGVQPGQRIALKENFDPASLHQLQREFTALSQVDHPNLPGYYEVFAAGGTSYLVMELVPGQNLQDVLDKRHGSLVESQVLGYAMQLCDALTCLHSQTPHILHRDIKPANIRLTPEGLIKLVDFGLLKQGLLATAHSIRGLGTLAYAPIEQYSSGGTDPRSDIYSLGATLYHLLTGQAPPPAIDRATATADTLLPPQRLNPRLSAGVSSAVLRAMAVRREDRFATAQQFKDALFGAGQPASLPTVPNRPPPPRPVPAAPSRTGTSRPLWPFALVGIALLTLLGFGLTGLNSGRNPQPSNTPPPLVTVEPTSGAAVVTPTNAPTNTPTSVSASSVSNSGARGRITFYSYRDGNAEIYVMNADGSGQTRLTNNPAIDWEPAWSPDGQHIVFTSRRDGNFEIYVMNADGSGQTRLTNNAAFESEPAWSPDGQHIAFTSYRDGDLDIWVMNADGSGQTWLTNNAASDSQPAWSPDGQHIAFTSYRDGDLDIYVMNADGNLQTWLTNNPTSDSQPAWSPDGQHIAFTLNRLNRDSNDVIYVMNADGSGQTRLTNNPAFDREPSWSPDGQRIAFASYRDGNYEIYVMNADGSGQTRITNNSTDDFEPKWTPK
ncbi:MAG: protein kinase [Chloroflexota bacterium]|nr:protein kinase [Chloroflexota bacterium]